MKTIKVFPVVFFLLLTAINLQAQPTFNIALVKDANSVEFNQACVNLKNEVSALTKARFNVSFSEFSGDWSVEKIRSSILNLMQNPKIDLVITVGFISSSEASNFKDYTKPLIALTILDQKMQMLPLKTNNCTGVKNFTYIESAIRLQDDIKSFKQMFAIKKLAVILPKPFKENFPQIDKYLNQDNAIKIDIISVGEDCSQAISKIPADADASLILPLIQSTDLEISKLFEGLNRKKLPSLAVSGIKYLEMGATITFTPKYNLQQIARLAALRILQISEGKNLSEIPISINGMHRAPVINMAGLRTIQKFPRWNYLNQAILINTTKFPSTGEMTFRMAIAEALENNLQGKISDHDLLMSEKDVRIAKSNIYPQIEIYGTAVELSQNIVESAMGQKGEFTLTGSAMLKQVVFSEAVFANIAINKLMAKNKKFFNNQTTLDVISNITNAYIGLLFAKSNLLIQSENVNATTQNLQTARAKEESGQSGISDVNRWISELNLNKMKLNDAYTLYRTNMYQINQILNKEIGEGINISDSNNFDESIIINKELLSTIFESPILTEKYADFILEQMHQNSPELKQLNTLEEIIKRKESLHRSKLYLPNIAVWGGLDQAFIRNGTIKPVGMPVPPPPDDLTWNVGLKVSLPLFEGKRTYTEMQKSKIELNKVNFQKSDLLNKLELGIRANVQKLRTSYLELKLSKAAANAASDNFKVVQDGYFQGVTNLVQLIDAQNVMSMTKHLANIANYQFILDYLQVERLQGKYIFLCNEDERQFYINQLKNYLHDLTKGE